MRELKIFSQATGLIIKDIKKLGGMSNVNHLITASDNQKYVLRMSGKNSNKIISRKKEHFINLAIFKAGFSVECVYFNEKSGIKITKFLSNAINLTPTNISQYLPNIAKRLKELHCCNVDLKYEFNPFDEMKKYLKVANKNKNLMPNFDTGLELFYNLKDEITKINQNFYNKDMTLAPTHGDLVPENIMVTKDDEIVFIDWEYAGKNDICWDLASVLVESKLNKEHQEIFLQNYNPDKAQMIKIEIYKSVMDILWCAWSLAKSDKNTNYLEYGKIRLNDALNRKFN